MPQEAQTSRTGTSLITPAMTVNDVVRAYPSTVGVFNDHGIDACCGGAAPVAEAAIRDGADGTALLADLNRVAGEQP
jgi:regulator of cell morphogenesis and NO signaling